MNDLWRMLLWAGYRSAQDSLYSDMAKAGWKTVCRDGYVVPEAGADGFALRLYLMDRAYRQLEIYEVI